MRRAVRITRRAISPRLATSTELITPEAYWHPHARDRRARRLRETGRRLRETGRRLRETGRRLRETGGCHIRANDWREMTLLRASTTRGSYSEATSSRSRSAAAAALPGSSDVPTRSSKAL